MSFLSEKYRTQSDTVDFASTPPGITLTDLDEMRSIDKPEALGLLVDTQAITDFLQDQGANPEHFQTSTIGIFGPRSPLGRIDMTSSRTGYVEKGLVLTDEVGYKRSLLMALQYDPASTNEKSINSTLRHEMSHLLDEDRVALYNRPKLSTRVRLGAFASSMAAIAPMPDIFTKQWIRHQALVEAMPFSGIMGIYAGISLAALYSAAVAREPGGLLDRLDSGERRANAFARKHKDFHPISLIPPVK